tara:strand:- start:5707 stop:6120 length:414 start_codon:yes stop_codon:yes gene_type:complete
MNPDKANDHIWFEKYKPLPNPIDMGGTYYAIDGVNYSWETFGPEHDIVSRTRDNFVWTLVETENGEEIIQGWHWVNRLAYFICEIGFFEERGEINHYTAFDNEHHLRELVAGGDPEAAKDLKKALLVEGYDYAWLLK